MRLFLGVDGGQSSTTALIADEHGRILAAASADVQSCHCRRRPRQIGARHLGERARCQEAQLDLTATRFVSACFGMSGGPEDKEAILAALIPADRLIVTHDAAVALFGAAETGQGLSPSRAPDPSPSPQRRRPDRARRRMGYVFGDEGGGFDIVRQPCAPRCAWKKLGTADVTPPGASRRHRAGERQPRAAPLLHSRLASRARRLAGLDGGFGAAEGDPVALRILESAAQELRSLRPRYARSCGGPASLSPWRTSAESSPANAC